MAAVRRLSAAALLLMLAVAVTPAAADPAMDAANLYMRDQTAGRSALLAFDRPDLTDVPPVARLLIGVIYLRDGNAGAAVRVFNAVVADPTVGPGLQQVAWNGIGWAQLSRGDLDAARFGFQQATTPTGPSALAQVVLGLIDAGDGKVDSAIAYLTPATTDPQAPPTLRAVARYGLAFARYHAGDYQTAVDEFRAVAADPVAGSLADDALYAAGLALWQSGQHDAAISAWRSLAGDTEGDDLEAKQIPRGLLRLDPTTWLRTGLKRLRTFPLAPQEIQLLRILDWDGAALARAMLLRVDRDGPPADDYDPAQAGAHDGDAGDRATAARGHRRRGDGLFGAGHGAGAAAPVGNAADGTAGGGDAPNAPPPASGTDGAFGTDARSAVAAVARLLADAAETARTHRGTLLAVLTGLLLAGGLWLMRRPDEPARPRR